MLTWASSSPELASFLTSSRFPLQVEAIGAESPAEDSQVLAAVSQITLINLDVKRPPLAAAAGDGAGPSQAVAAAPGPKKALGKGEREAALQALAADGWLVAPRAGYYTLGVRRGGAQGWVGGAVVIPGQERAVWK